MNLEEAKMINLPTYGKLLFDFLSREEDKSKYKKMLLPFDDSIHKVAEIAPADACLLFQGINELFDKTYDLKEEAERFAPNSPEYINLYKSIKHIEQQAIAINDALQFILYEHSIGTENSDSAGYEMLEDWKYAGVVDSSKIFELEEAALLKKEEKATKTIH